MATSVHLSTAALLVAATLCAVPATAQTRGPVPSDVQPRVLAQADRRQDPNAARAFQRDLGAAQRRSNQLGGRIAPDPSRDSRPGLDRDLRNLDRRQIEQGSPMQGYQRSQLRALEREQDSLLRDDRMRDSLDPFASDQTPPRSRRLQPGGPRIVPFGLEALKPETAPEEPDDGEAAQRSGERGPTGRVGRMPQASNPPRGDPMLDPFYRP